MSNQNEILDVTQLPDESAGLEVALRPTTLDEFVGQEKLKENLRIFIKAAKSRKEALDHCLFYAPPGLGKTTLANILAKEKISIEALTQKGVIKHEQIAEIVILTHTTQEKHIKAAIAAIEQLPNIHAPVVMIRMESFHIDNWLSDRNSCKIRHSEWSEESL